MNITFLGQGAMGVRMADRLEAAGYKVTRWNRSGTTQSSREAVADANLTTVSALYRSTAEVKRLPSPAHNPECRA